MAPSSTARAVNTSNLARCKSTRSLTKHQINRLIPIVFVRSLSLRCARVATTASPAITTPLCGLRASPIVCWALLFMPRSSCCSYRFGCSYSSKAARRSATPHAMELDSQRHKRRVICTSLVRHFETPLQQWTTVVTMTTALRTRLINQGAAVAALESFTEIYSLYRSPSWPIYSNLAQHNVLSRKLLLSYSLHRTHPPARPFTPAFRS